MNGNLSYATLVLGYVYTDFVAPVVYPFVKMHQLCLAGLTFVTETTRLLVDLVISLTVLTLFQLWKQSCCYIAAQAGLLIMLSMVGRWLKAWFQVFAGKKLQVSQVRQGKVDPLTISRPLEQLDELIFTLSNGINVAYRMNLEPGSLDELFLYVYSPFAHLAKLAALQLMEPKGSHAVLFLPGTAISDSWTTDVETLIKVHMAAMVHVVKMAKARGFHQITIRSMAPSNVNDSYVAFLSESLRLCLDGAIVDGSFLPKPLEEFSSFGLINVKIAQSDICTCLPYHEASRYTLLENLISHNRAELFRFAPSSVSTYFRLATLAGNIFGVWRLIYSYRLGTEMDCAEILRMTSALDSIAGRLTGQPFREIMKLFQGHRKAVAPSGPASSLLPQEEQQITPLSSSSSEEEFETRPVLFSANSFSSWFSSPAPSRKASISQPYESVTLTNSTNNAEMFAVPTANKL